MKYFGKYRGIVLDKMDINHQGRIKAKVPSVPGADQGIWCMPCVPFAGKNCGFKFLPSIGDNVWVEFEEGKKSKPIWSGSFWNSGGIPTGINPDNNCLKTKGGNAIIMDDDSQGWIYIQTKDSKAYISMNNRSGYPVIDLGDKKNKATLVLDQAWGVTLKYGHDRIVIRQNTVSVNNKEIAVFKTQTKKPQSHPL